MIELLVINVLISLSNTITTGKTISTLNLCCEIYPLRHSVGPINSGMWWHVEHSTVLLSKYAGKAGTWCGNKAVVL